jgi:hypothetical protein
MVSAIVTQNEVVDYYRDNAGKNLSLKKVSKALKIKFGRGVYLVNHTDKLTKTNRYEVGCGKSNLLVYRYACDVV